ncbi:MAG: DUF115 domain-containing protein [Anaerolineaceae bacterium]|nr:DUF115 domain-containing protein [Anaerolineaceae bacterium]
MSEKTGVNLPPGLIETARRLYDGARRLPELPAAYLHPWRRESIQKLGLLQNSHKGERCFLIGNGPSLKHTDLSLLKNEFTFGFNRIFLAAEELNFSPSCLVSINDLVIEQSAQEFRALAMPKFFAWRSHRWVGMDANTHYLYTSYTSPKFARDVRGRVWEGATVTNVALQLAYFMGFSTVILVGVDHSFATKGTPNTTVQSEGDDPNHFSSAYFGKGFRWQLPDLETSELAYRMARQGYEADGRQVLDATIGGKLTVFPKVEYTSLFD